MLRPVRDVCLLGQVLVLSPSGAQASRVPRV